MPSFQSKHPKAARRISFTVCMLMPRLRVLFWKHPAEPAYQFTLFVLAVVNAAMIATTKV
ncbi:hypothetical protein [Luteolibacter sp. Populi]|uniref:hypothetical protein n=1 Tax=Luteolibacter sp. Populi TaxID=3230487 RepID=UPI0034655DA3